jgi:hypothetical protein
LVCFEVVIDWILKSLELINGTPLPHVAIPFCPSGARPMYKPDGEPRKCLPHQSNLCLNAVDDKVGLFKIFDSNYL